MASGRIVIPVGLETSGVAKGAKDAEKSLKDLEDAVSDTGKEGARDLDKLEDELKDVQRQSKKTEKSVDDIGDGAKKGFGNAKGASGEFKDEALANFSEVTSSFDGSMQSIGDLAQGTLGGVAANIPGIGVAAGVAAAGIGLITSEMVAAQEKSEQIKQNIIDDFLELGDALDKEAVDARVRDILGTKETMAQAKLLADVLDITVGEAALAMAGDFESAGKTAEEVIAGIDAAGGDVDLKVWQELQNTIDSTTEGMEAGKQAAEAQAEAQRRTAATTKQAQAEQRDAVAKTKAQLEAMARGNYTARLNVDINDRTRNSVDQIVNRINGRIASIQVNAGIGGRSAV